MGGAVSNAFPPPLFAVAGGGTGCDDVFKAFKMIVFDVEAGRWLA